jgi:hypothetical protein
MTTAPIVVENNKLTASVVPYGDVRVLETTLAHYSPRTTFPTFDCFYFHTDDTVFPLQMNIALIHPWKNCGAANAKKYFDAMFGKRKPKKYRKLGVYGTNFRRTYLTL